MNRRIALGSVAHIAGCTVLIWPERITVWRGEQRIGHDVPNHGTSIGELAARPGFCVGWARMPDDAEILYFYDRDDAGFGYALNLDAPWCSEWGYAPFTDEEAA